MDHIRGVILIAAGGFALYRGWTLHTGQRALMAYALGVLALALGAWRITRKPDRRNK